MAHTDYSKMEANHKARRTSERFDTRKTRTVVRKRLSDILDFDNLILPTRNVHTGKRCSFCKTPGFWCSC